VKIRSAYLKVTDMTEAVAFWSSFLLQEPAKQSTHWSEFVLGEVRLGFLLNDFGEEIRGNGCVPVFELAPTELAAYIERAKSLGATVVMDGLASPQMNSIVMAAPTGHEFELCNCR
jgi:predicted enzyme related to lactoylglutathione lyase